jgi:hypothetical protein
MINDNKIIGERHGKQLIPSLCLRKQNFYFSKNAIFLNYFENEVNFSRFERKSKFYFEYPHKKRLAPTTMQASLSYVPYEIFSTAKVWAFLTKSNT